MIAPAFACLYFVIEIIHRVVDRTLLEGRGRGITRHPHLTCPEPLESRRPAS